MKVRGSGNYDTPCRIGNVLKRDQPASRNQTQPLHCTRSPFNARDEYMPSTVISVTATNGHVLLQCCLLMHGDWLIRRMSFIAYIQQNR